MSALVDDRSGWRQLAANNIEDAWIAVDVLGRYDAQKLDNFGVARVDDILNLAPSIIAGPAISIAAIFVPRTNAFAAFGSWISYMRARCPVRFSRRRGDGGCAEGFFGRSPSFRQ